MNSLCKNKLNKTLRSYWWRTAWKNDRFSSCKFGISCYFYDPDKNAPAQKISQLFFNYSFDNKKKLIEFAKYCDFITYEFENIPLNTLHKISKYKKIYPGIKALQISQDRFLEKSFIENLGIKVADYKKVNSLDDIKENFKTKI